MDTEALANKRIGKVFIRVVGAAMESGLRYRFFGPKRILNGTEIQNGQTVLEIGCGTGYFTLPAAELLGEHGSLVAMDILPLSVEIVARKVQTANLKNVNIVKGNALDTKLEAESLDVVLVFGVIPAPMIPTEQLLSEIHRILKPGGIIAVWPSRLVHKAIAKSGLFTFSSKKNGVSNYRK